MTDAAVHAEEIMPDTGPGMEWYRELADEDHPAAAVTDTTRGRADAQRREEQAKTTLAAIKAKAAARTGWEPWMTDEAGWGALREGWAEQAQALDERRSRYPRDQASLAERRRRAVCDE